MTEIEVIEKIKSLCCNDAYTSTEKLQIIYYIIEVVL